MQVCENKPSDTASRQRRRKWTVPQTIDDSNPDSAETETRISAEPEPRLPRARSFYDWHWRTRWLIAGMAFPALLYALISIDRAPLPGIPWWLWVPIFPFIAFVLMIVLPLLSRTKSMRPETNEARPVRWLREAGVAALGVVATFIVLIVADIIYTILFPGELAESPFRDMPLSRNYLGMAIWMVFAFTLGPVAEEIFFRGFLHNALCRRMPLLLAIIIQCLIFGLYHPYGALGNSMVALSGVIFTLIYQWRKTLVAPILTHAGFNFLFCLAMASQMYMQAIAPVMGVSVNSDGPACIVIDVSEGSGAAAAGLRAGDVITSIDGQPIADFKGLLETIRYHQPGDSVAVTAERDGVEHTFTVVLQERTEP